MRHESLLAMTQIATNAYVGTTANCDKGFFRFFSDNKKSRDAPNVAAIFIDLCYFTLPLQRGH